MAISEGSEEFTIIDKCNSDYSEEEKLFDDCGQEEYMRDLSPDHLVKVEDGCGYDAFHGYRNKRIAPVLEIWEYPGHKRFKRTMEIKDVVTEHALELLPAKTLSRFRAVSKEWNELITSPFFMHKQAYRFRDISGLFCQLPGDRPFFLSLNRDAYGVPSPSLSFLPEPVTVRTSCNGLLCCQSCDGENTYYICNPANREWSALPKSNFYHGPEPALALAFEPSVLNFAEHFQLVCAFSLTDHPVICFEIYSSRSSSWRLADTECCELDALKLNGDGLFLKGVAFWETSAGAVLAFDLNDEHYGILSLPPNSGPHGALTEMNGELCYLLPRKDENEYTLDIYGDMDMGLKHSIALGREFFNNFNKELRALACVNNDVVIFDFGKGLYAYNRKTGKAEILSSGDGTDVGYVRYLPYVNNLVHVRPSYMSSILAVDRSAKLAS